MMAMERSLLGRTAGQESVGHERKARGEEPMPDPLLILKASIAAGAVAALFVLWGGWPWRRPHLDWVGAGAAVGVGAGLFVGAWLLGLAPRLPPSEDN